MKPLKRGEVWWVNFHSKQSKGGLIQKARPAIIISNNASNRVLNRVQIMPVTSNVSRIFSSEARVVIKNRIGKALANQIQTIAKSCLSKRMGELSEEELKGVEKAIKIQLGLL